MGRLNKNILHLYYSLFFVLVLFVHVLNGVFIERMPFITYVIDVILGSIFYIIYLKKLIKSEITTGIIFILWSIFVMFNHPESTLAYSIPLIYGVMLILKIIKIRMLPVIFTILFIFTILITSFVINEISLFKIVLNLLLIIVFSCVHNVIFYSEYNDIPDMKLKYSLTDQEILIINQLFNKDPSNKHMATVLFTSESTIKADLGSIYKKMGIVSGGSKKVELIAKLAIEGYLVK